MAAREERAVDMEGGKGENNTEGTEGQLNSAGASWCSPLTWSIAWPQSDFTPG